MPSYKRISCFLILILFLLTANALIERFRSVTLSGPLQNLRVFNGKIYIGGTNMLYILNNDLSINQLASTCTSVWIPCGNINKILLVLGERDECFVCGTANKGICEIRSIDNIKTVLSSKDLRLVDFSEDPYYPVQSIRTIDGQYVIAVSLGDLHMYSSERFIIKWNDSFYDRQYLYADIIESYVPDFTIFFKAILKVNWNTYLVTNQKKNIRSANFVSKLLWLYKNDIYYIRSFASIVLSCLYNGIEYNLIQNAVQVVAPSSFGLLSNDTIFVGAFTRGNDPTDPSGNTAICVSKISDINQEILKAEENFEPHWFTKKCYEGVEGPYRHVYCKLLSGCGCYTHKMTATYILGTETGHVTALDGTATSSENIVLIAGTSVGFLLQLTLTSLESPMEVFSTAKLKSPIIQIHIQDEDTIYVLGSQHVFSYSQSNCSEFKSVTETMTGRNPLCGWCVFQQRATTKPNCSEARYHWISSLHKMQVTPSNIHVKVSKTTNVKVMISFDHLPKPRKEDVFKCRLVDNKNFIIASDLQAENNGSAISCAMPFIKEHVELKLGVSVVQTTLNESILILEAVILFFECVKLQRCSDCIEISNHQCSWCNDAVNCMPRYSLCKSQLIVDKEFCPQLTDSRGRLYAHAGILTFVPFQGKHLPKPESKNFYACKMNSTALSRASTVNDSIICSINVHHLSDSPLHNETTEIYYVSQRTGTPILLDGYKNYVTVYNCSMLAKDCSHCKALNKTRFHCNWCTNTNKCEYKDRNCSSTICPAPTITKVIPRDGPVDGGTRITVYGLNLGSSLLDNISVEIANISCVINVDMSQSNEVHSGIFQSNVGKRIICLTGSSQNETSEAVLVSVNGMISNLDVTFYYRVPTATGIEPSFGPEAGGTRVTIFGENLGIGNRNVYVTFGGSKCSSPEVIPALTLGNVTPTNFTIVCTAGKKEEHAINGVSLKIDRSEITIPYAFTFIADPIIHPLSPQKAFLSGGTKITVEGVQLTNAHNARLILRHKVEIKTGDCNILSGRLVTCQTPEAPESVRKEFLKFDNTTDRFSQNITVEGLFYLDNVNKSVEIWYCQDPIINDLTTEGDHVVKFEANTRRLNIYGSMLTHVATKFDINVTVGVASCVIVELSMTCITCIAPKYEARSGIPNATRSEVNVTIGNIQKIIGYVEYTETSPGTTGTPETIENSSSYSSSSDNYVTSSSDNSVTSSSDNSVILSDDFSVILSVTGAGAALIFINVTAIVLICRQYRKAKSRVRNLVNKNSTKKETPCELRLSRIAVSSCEMNYSEVYNEPYESDHYDTIAADDISIYRWETDTNYLNCPRERVSEASTSTSEQSQNYLHPTNHITAEVQLEETIATNVESESELTGDQLYLHVINDSNLSD